MIRDVPPTALKVGTRAWENGPYEGVLRRGRTTLWGCGHHHNNRDISTGINGTSALDCVEVRVRSVRSDRVAKDWQANVRASTARAARLNSVGSADAARMVAKAEETIEAFGQQVAALAALVGDEPVYGGGGSVVITPPAPTGVCPTCGVEVVAMHWRGPTPPTSDWSERNYGRAWESWASWRSVAFSYVTGHTWCRDGRLDHDTPRCSQH